VIHPVDTILCDTAKIAGYQADKRFDYNSQLGVPEVNLLDMFLRWLSRFLRPVFGGETVENVTGWLLIGLFVVVAGLVAYFVYKKRPELFFREKKRPLAYGIEEENIYRIDFDKELTDALAAGDFRTAIRILYLQTLRFVADKKWIDWQLYKTPTEYTCELKPPRLKASFRDFTNRFLQVRYGHFKATRELYDTMCGLQDKLKEGGDDEDDGE
jgi:hypothetical protein